MSTDLQKKLFDFEAVPPQAAWDRIADELISVEATYPRRLQNFEIQPPAGSWTTIAAALDTETATAKLVPFFTRYRTPLRYVAAASLVAVLLFFATLGLRRSEATLLGDKNKPSNSTQPVPGQVDAARKQNGETASSAVSLSGMLGSKRGTATSLKKSLATIRPQNIFSSFAFSRRLIPRRAAETTLNLSSPDNFMVYSDGEGNVMKLSKKLFSLVNCPDGDGTCRERILALQEKLSANTNPADFMGMLDLLRQLQ